tara:strand:+ start:33821 stop:34189 length:369 start_codon:yes stop_codon:yes gene_type:complete
MKNLLLVLLLVISFTSCEDDCTQEAYCQLLSSQDYGKSGVSQKGNAKVFVCHNGNTLEISENALQAHLNHGDYEGECGTLSSNNLEFKDGEIVDIPCGYDIPFIHVTNNGTQWRYSSPGDRW